MKNPSRRTILITGGAGFIGSFLVDKLVSLGHEVLIFDNLEEQVHHKKKPAYIDKKATFIKADVRDYKTFQNAIESVDIVYHLASRVGVAQSNYEIKEYVDTNVGGMANLLDVLVNKKNHVAKVIMIASMTSYGEGDYACEACGIVKPPLRGEEQLQKGDWEIHCPNCQKYVSPLATKEDSKMNDNSVYALTKRAQEEILLLIGKMYNIPVVSLRCFNVYGPRQSLSNPYTGVTAIFLSRIKNNKKPIIYEDGLQTRDFVSVYDVVDALVRVMGTSRADFQSLNIGSGKATSIKDVTLILNNLLNKSIEPEITSRFRKNDIRHCFADIHKAKKLLSWEPRVSLEKGFRELIGWAQEQSSTDLFEQAEKELREKKLL